MKFTAGSSLNGLILISRQTVLQMENDAQLAAVLARQVAAVVQEQEYRIKHRRELASAIGWGSTAASFVPLVGLAFSAAHITNDIEWQRYVRSLGQQNTRITMEYLLQAGYDPREAQTAFDSLSKKSRHNPKFGRAEREGYAIARAEAAKQLHEFYKDASFPTGKTNEAAYQELLKEARKFGAGTDKD